MLQKLPECQIPELRNSQCQDQPLTSQHRFPLCAQLFLCLLASEQGSSKGLHIICELWVKTVKPNETQWFCHGSEVLFYQSQECALCISCSQSLLFILAWWQLNRSSFSPASVVARTEGTEMLCSKPD